MEKAFSVNTPFFNPKDTLECGQVFRYKKLENGDYQVISKDKICLIKENPSGGFDFYTKDGEYFYNYFDFQTDYQVIYDNLINLPLMKDAIPSGMGIRILKQDSFEALIGFIISANNHIPRIKGIIEKICENLGENMGDFYAFPTPLAMAKAGQEFYKSIGAGYRDRYLAETSRDIARGNFSLEVIATLPTEKAKKELCKLLGVGGKVADCILQYGFGRSDVFPTDTWIKKMYKRAFGENSLSGEEIREKLVGIYGNYSGFAQQYLFYAERES